MVRNFNAKTGAMSPRAILPGAVIAAMLTAAALLALLVALSIRGEGPFSIGLGDAGGTARLDGGPATTLGELDGGPVETAPVVLSSGGGGAAPAAGTAPGRSRTTPLRSAARDPQSGDRRRAQAPSQPSPVSTPTAPSTTNNTTSSGGTTTRPTPISTPDPTAEKVRGRGETPQKVDVKKQRVTNSPAATPVPVPVRPVPAPTAPEVVRRSAPTPTPAATGDDVLRRVPPPSATP
jgi:hypothetical protein